MIKNIAVRNHQKILFLLAWDVIPSLMKHELIILNHDINTHTMIIYICNKIINFGIYRITNAFFTLSLGTIALDG